MKKLIFQSPYFQSMFSGNWKEASESHIHIEILDENINIEGKILRLIINKVELVELRLSP